MHFKSVVCFLFALALIQVASAQTKVSGTLKCDKPDPSYSIPVGDQPDHAYSILRGKCTWTKALEIGGAQSKDLDLTGFGNFRGARGQVRGDSTGTMSSGDKVFIIDQGTVTINKDGTATEEGTWSFSGGTGKLKGLKGKGTFKGALTADSSGTFEVEGEYQLPPAS
jgi:hypothetical protein